MIRLDDWLLQEVEQLLLATMIVWRYNFLLS